MKTVLIVDDDALLCEALKAALERKSYRVEIAHEGKAGVKLAEMTAPDVVVLDLFMPGMEGMETIRKLRALAPKTPIYVVSGGGQKQLYELLDVADSLGATGTLRKPFTAGELIALIEKAA